MEGWVDLGTCMVTYTARWFTCPQAVTHRSTNPTQCRANSMIEHKCYLSLRHSTYHVHKVGEQNSLMFREGFSRAKNNCNNDNLGKHHKLPEWGLRQSPPSRKCTLGHFYAPETTHGNNVVFLTIFPRACTEFPENDLIFQCSEKFQSNSLLRVCGHSTKDPSCFHRLWIPGLAASQSENFRITYCTENLLNDTFRLLHMIKYKDNNCSHWMKYFAHAKTLLWTVIHQSQSLHRS